MIYDFTCTCKTYNKASYKKEFFKSTPCTACPAIGRFNLHGSYERYVVYFEKLQTIEYKLLEIKRVICKSCSTTHAVMPGDIIPYKTLALFALFLILVSIYMKKSPVLEIVKVLGSSAQFIYSVKHIFHVHINNIRQYFREVSQGTMPPVLDAHSILTLIKEPCLDFQFGYIKYNRRPCFMCKFFYKGGAPPVGLYAPAGAAT